MSTIITLEPLFLVNILIRAMAKRHQRGGHRNPNNPNSLSSRVSICPMCGASGWEKCKIVSRVVNRGGGELYGARSWPYWSYEAVTDGPLGPRVVATSLPVGITLAAHEAAVKALRQKLRDDGWEPAPSEEHGQWEYRRFHRDRLDLRPK